MELSNYFVSWVVTYLADLQPTYIGVIFYLLSTMDIPVMELVSPVYNLEVLFPFEAAVLGGSGVPLHKPYPYSLYKGCEYLYFRYLKSLVIFFDQERGVLDAFGKKTVWRWFIRFVDHIIKVLQRLMFVQLSIEAKKCSVETQTHAWMSQEVSKWLVNGGKPQYTPFIRRL